MTEGRHLELVLPAEALPRLERERAAAELEYVEGMKKLIEGDATDRLKQQENLIIGYIAHKFFAFAEEALNSQNRVWLIRKYIDRYLLHAIDSAFLEKHPNRFNSDRDEKRARFHDLAAFMICHSDGWVEMQKALLEKAAIEEGEMARAEEQGNGGDAVDNRDHPNRKAVDAFLEEVNRFLPPGARRVTRADIWRVAKYRDRTLLNRWERGKLPDDSEAAQAFHRVLALSPEEFLQKRPAH